MSKSAGVVNDKYNLVTRTSDFGREIISFAVKLPNSKINQPIVNQLVRSGTSIGANYMEADCAESKKDFVHKISICKKESKETYYWLQMVAHANEEYAREADRLGRESYELLLIFSSIIKRVRT
jgi:four helix bundle protein